MDRGGPQSATCSWRFGERLVQDEDCRKDWIVLIGHIACCCFAHRDPMCLLFAVYKFGRLSLIRAVPLLPGAREMLEAPLGLIPLLRSDWTLQWCQTPVASVAPEDRCGICIGPWPAGETAKAGRNFKRARLRKLGGVDARQHYFEQAGLATVEEGEWNAVDDGEGERHARPVR